MKEADELMERYQKEVIESYKGENIAPRIYVDGIFGLDEIPINPQQSDLQKVVNSIRSPMQRSYWGVFIASSKVKETTFDLDENDLSDLSGVDMDENSIYMQIMIVYKPDDTFVYLFDRETGNLHQELTKQAEQITGNLI